MTYRAVLRGHLLEEALAWLLRNAGYRLLVSESDDSEALEMDAHTRRVKGQGEAARPFLERNTHGSIHDVNEPPPSVCFTG